jgi:general secretion pathway protein N
LPVKLETQGRFLLSLGTFEQATPYCQILNGKVTWQNAGVAYLGQSVNLGELAGTLGCDNGAITLAIKDVNPLGLQADIKVAEGNKVSAKGFVKPDGTMPRSVHQVVQMFGQPDREGRYIINL